MIPRGLGTWIVIGVMVLTMGTATAFEEPKGFKEANFGDSEQAVRAKLNIPAPEKGLVVGGRDLAPGMTFDRSCHDFSKALAWAGHRWCTQANTIGDIRVDVTYTFRDDKLVRIRFTFNPAAYPDIAKAFGSRFGKPSVRETHVMKTGFGVEYLNEQLGWNGRVVAIGLSKYLDKVTESEAVYVLHSEITTKDRLVREQGAKAAEDLK